jgi:tetratricopeptide (TPR) repeat protein
VANTRINLARPLLEQGRYEEAAGAAREGLDVTRGSLGGEHPRVAYGEVYLARADLALGRAPEAEALARDAVRIRQKTYPADDWRIGAAQSVLGEALTRLGRLDEADSMLRAARGSLKPLPGAQAQEAGATELRIAALAAARARPNQHISNR